MVNLKKHLHLKVLPTQFNRTMLKRKRHAFESLSKMGEDEAKPLSVSSASGKAAVVTKPNIIGKRRWKQ